MSKTQKRKKEPMDEELITLIIVTNVIGAVVMGWFIWTIFDGYFSVMR